MLGNVFSNMYMTYSRRLTARRATNNSYKPKATRVLVVLALLMGGLGAHRLLTPPQPLSHIPTPPPPPGPVVLSVAGDHKGDPDFKCLLPAAGAAEQCEPACLADFATWNPEVARLVREGRQKLGGKKVIIAGLARDAAKTLRQMHCLMKQTVHRALDHRVIIFENDSDDNTYDIMRKICAADKKTVCINSMGVGSTRGDWGPFGRQRFEKMAEFRNTLVGKIVHDPELRTWDAAIFVDMDLLDQAWLPEWEPSRGEELPYALGRPPYAFAKTKAEGWRPAMVATVFGLQQPWDAVCANGVWNFGHTYDTLALRTAAYPDTMRHPRTQLWPAMRDKSLLFRGHDMIPVKSCFGGLSVYNLSAMVATKCWYTGDDCEHVTYNDCLRNAGRGKFFVNPLMTTHYDGSSPRVCKDPCLRAHTY